MLQNYIKFLNYNAYKRINHNLGKKSRNLLKHDDFSGKTIVPFCSMGGGRFGQTISAIAKLAPESVILKGLDVTYSSYDRTAIRSWLDGISQYQP